MSAAVWKFAIPQGPTPTVVSVEMPVDSEIIHFGQQDETPVVWAIVNPDEQRTEARHILVVPTGERIEGGGFYLGSTFLFGGAIVAHGFEIGGPAERSHAEFEAAIAEVTRPRSHDADSAA